MGEAEDLEYRKFVVNFHGTADNPKLVLKENDMADKLIHEDMVDINQGKMFLELFRRLVEAIESISLDMRDVRSR